MWGQPAENIAETITRGDRVLVHGHVETETWEDRETGEKRTRDVVVVNERDGEIGVSLSCATAQLEKRTPAAPPTAARMPTATAADPTHRAGGCPRGPAPRPAPSPITCRRCPVLPGSAHEELECLEHRGSRTDCLHRLRCARGRSHGHGPARHRSGWANRLRT
ncbi:single-stranded DNA-binding protein [Nocardioides sp. CPCC 205120]|uniref:single-stranded DNA-binding protein n=1 Tax=Nocardioides sp. CPCC 205120 TaxID=3406462 RepID=UPI003B50453A